MPDILKIDVDDQIATLTMNRPGKRNTMCKELRPGGVFLRTAQGCARGDFGRYRKAFLRGARPGRTCA